MECVDDTSCDIDWTFLKEKNKYSELFTRILLAQTKQSTWTLSVDQCAIIKFKVCFTIISTPHIVSAVIIMHMLA